MRTALVFCCLVVLAGCAPRYQLTSVGKGSVWKLDTKTGDLWFCEAEVEPPCFKAHDKVWKSE
jgi:hypothetical protein